MSEVKRNLMSPCLGSSLPGVDWRRRRVPRSHRNPTPMDAPAAITTTGDVPSDLSSGKVQSDPSLGWRGYSVGGVVRVGALGAASVAGYWLASNYSGQPFREALTAALIPVGFIMVFGFGYAGDTFWKRRARYGPDREAPTTVLVLLFFVTALVTVALILVYLAISPGDRICVGPCGFEVRIPGLARPWAPFVLTYSRLGKWAAAGVGLLLAGSFPLLLSLFRPRTFDSRASGFDYRRFDYRALDILVLMVLTAGVFVFGVKVLGESRMPWATSRWIVISLLLVVPFLYEFLPCVLPRFSGKWWPGLQVVSVVDGDTVVWWRSAIRGLVTSFVFSVGVDLAVFLWKSTFAYEVWLFGARVLLLLAICAAVTHARGRGIHDVVLGTYVWDRPKDTTERHRPRGIRLRPIEFSVTEADPFVDDVLGRCGVVEALAAIIMGTDGAGALMVDAPWGSGKTAYLRMCAAYLRSHGVTVVEFNAWTEQYTKRPLLDMVGALSTRLPGDISNRIEAGASELMTLLNAAQPGPPVVSWDDHRRAVATFQESLRAVADDQKLLVVIVDELDRCEPDYGIEALADIHHLFSVPGVVVLLGVNGAELCKSIESKYGQGFDSRTYLKRFVDHTIALPLPDQTDLGRFMEALYRSVGIDTRVQGEKYTRLILETLAKPEARTLRDLEQLVYRVSLVFTSIPRAPEDAGSTDFRWVWEQAAMTLLILREAAPDTYEAFSAGRDDALQAVAVLRAGVDDIIVQRMAVVLLLVTHKDSRRPPSEWPIWNQHSSTKHYSSDWLSQVRGLCERFIAQGISPRTYLPDKASLIARIEMVQYDPE